MRDAEFIIRSNREIARDTFEMVLSGDASDCARPGTFVNVHVDGLYLRRPISVCFADGEKMILIYKVVGKGTDKMAHMKEGESVMALTNLGNGFDLSKAGERPTLLGGGSGVAPMYGLAKALIEMGKTVRVAIGFRSEKDVYYKREFEEAGAEVLLYTEDGSIGEKGFATDHLPGDSTFLYACGPMPMLNAARKHIKTPAQYSFEARMACGFGACMGCSMEMKTGLKRVCKDGPVFDGEEILWP
ncbi:MAG: dihydroorotate dehydrogenase electron transfer subunit [Clostridia bacterium]|nr:dihydroorotate dehydrogenase electron transfer subunit [Clostridia bacterium]